MALDHAQLKTDIEALLTAMEKETEDAKSTFANKLAQAICDYIKTGTVTVASGIAVSTAGTAAAQTGSTTATGTGTIS